MVKDKSKNIKQNLEVETGYFENGLPYAKIGRGKNIIVNIEALTYKHEPASGFILKQFIKDSEPFIDEYTIYLIGRKPNLPQGYFMDHMADDYARVIREEFQNPVIIMGASTGGQIAQVIAANNPDLVQKLIIISAAYRISEQGEEIERRSAECFARGQYGKYLSTSMELIYGPGIKRTLIKGFIRIIGKLLVRKVQYPNDYLVEVEADREMDFKERLKDIRAPTLILSGVRDICYNVDDVKKTADGIPNSELILYDDYGHNLLIANRDQIQKEIVGFLKN